MSLYQLIGAKDLKRGTLVDMGPGGHRYGIVQSIVKEDYQLPDKCVVSGPIKFYQQPVNLYLIRGIEKNDKPLVGGHVFSWVS